MNLSTNEIPMLRYRTKIGHLLTLYWPLSCRRDHNYTVVLNFVAHLSTSKAKVENT